MVDEHVNSFSEEYRQGHGRVHQIERMVYVGTQRPCGAGSVMDICTV